MFPPNESTKEKWKIMSMYGVVRSWRKKAQIYPWSSPPFSPPLCVWPEVLLRPDSLPSAHRAYPSCLVKSCSLGWSPPSHTSRLCLFSCSCFSGAENKGGSVTQMCVFVHPDPWGLVRKVCSPPSPVSPWVFPVPSGTSTFSRYKQRFPAPTPFCCWGDRN